MYDGLPANVVHESEVQRQHPRVRIPGVVRIGSGRADGAHPLIDVSVGGLAFEGRGGRWRVGDTLNTQVLFKIQPVTLSLPLNLRVRNVDNGGHRVGCAFESPGPREISVLRQLVGGILASELTVAGDVITALSRDNFARSRKTGTQGASLSAPARMRALTMTALMFAIGVCAFFYAISKLYAMAFVTRATAAKVAAPAVSVAMPRDGTFFSLVPKDGIVHKGQPLGSFQAAMLDVVQPNLGSVHLTPEQLSDLMGEALKGTLSSPCDCRVLRQFSTDGQYVSRGQPLFELMPADAKAYVLARFPFEDLDKIPIGRSVAFRIAGQDVKHYGTVSNVRLLSGDEAASADMRGLDSGGTSGVVVQITPDRPLPASAIDRPVIAVIGGQSALTGKVLRAVDSVRQETLTP